MVTKNLHCKPLCNSVLTYRCLRHTVRFLQSYKMNMLRSHFSKNVDIYCYK